MKKRYRVWVNASVVYTGIGVEKKEGRRVGAEDLGELSGGALVCDYLKSPAGKIAWVGLSSRVPSKYLEKKSLIRRIDLKGKKAIMPGLVDCHTHLVFAGDRSDEFARRCAGATYEEIAASGGGIVSTVRATRGATETELLRLARKRLKEVAAWGIRTLEIKSGYGLSHESELKILRVIARLREECRQSSDLVLSSMKICSTYLGAHAFPTDRSREEYLAEIDKTLVTVARLKLATAVDVFIDQGYFTRAEGKSILQRAKSLDLAVKIHGDELFETGSAKLGADLGALSVDHLLKVSPAGVQALAESETTAVLLPATAFFLKADHAPARALIDSGARVALSTDFNPGTSMTLSLPLVMTMAALYLKMSKAEIFAAVTYNAARALNLHGSRGVLRSGMDAAFTVMPFMRFEEMYYRFGWVPGNFQ